MLRVILLFSMVMSVAGDPSLAEQYQRSDLPEPQQWNDSSCKHDTEAVFAGRSGQTVYLRKTKDASVIEMPLANLSEKNQKFIKEKLAGCRVIGGEVIYVFDGDSITVLETDGAQKQEYQVRLGHIDAPEPYQAFGSKAKQDLSSKIFGKEVRVVWREKDKYRRILGDVYLGKRFINGEMVSDGFAWHYKRYSKSKALGDCEKQAKEAKRGLWIDESPTPPWDFRHKNSDTTKLSQQPTEDSQESSNDSAPVYVTRSGKKYHRGSCSHLSKSKIPISLEDAKKRYSPCKSCKP